MDPMQIMIEMLGFRHLKIENKKEHFILLYRDTVTLARLSSALAN